MRRAFAVLWLVSVVGCFDDGGLVNQCRTADDCERGRVCGESPIDPGRMICMSACVIDDDCAEGEVCSFGRCMPPLPTGDAAAMTDAGADDLSVGDLGPDEGPPAADVGFDLAMPDLAMPDAAFADGGLDGDAPDVAPFDAALPGFDGLVDDDRGVPDDADGGR